MKTENKYLETLRILNLTRSLVYRNIMKSLDKHFQQLFATFSRDSGDNLSEIEGLVDGKKSRQPSVVSRIMNSILFPSVSETAGDLFDRCRQAEWRLLRFYEQLIDDPRTSPELRSVLVPQRDKVMHGYEHLNLLSQNPW